MPATADFEKAMRLAGVSAGRPVVVYDDADSTAAARAWWLLRYFGHPSVRVLDGGFRAWTAAGYPVDPPSPLYHGAIGDFTARPGHLDLLDADGAASIAIGVLLVAVAIKLGMDSRELLIGRAADSEVQQLIREEIESQPGVDALLEELAEVAPAIDIAVDNAGASIPRGGLLACPTQRIAAKVAGAADVHARVSPEPLDLGALAARVGRPAAGAVVTFSGTTRDVERLDYEAYAEMAQERIATILTACVERYGLQAAAAEHRIGAVPRGEASVVVAVSAGHRAEAFAGAREAIDRIKAEAPIWKVEVAADGSERRVAGTPAPGASAR